MQTYANQVVNEMSGTKLAATRIGEMFRDFALHNYSRRYGWDNYVGLALPYQFWYTRTMQNWGMRVADRPATLAFFARLSKFTDENMDEETNLPSRLRGRFRIPIGGLPDFMGGSLYFDPMGKIFQYREFLRPLEQVIYGQRRENYRVQDLLRDWAKKGDITQEEYDQAMKDKGGVLWDRAMQMAKSEDSADWVDFMSLVTSPALYLTVPWALIKGKPEEIGAPYPPSRVIQAIATATGQEWVRKLDVLGKVTESLGVSKFGRWGDIYIERQLASMVAEGLVNEKDARRAMIEKQGTAYDQAIQRVQQEMMIREPGMAGIYEVGRR